MRSILPALVPAVAMVAHADSAEHRLKLEFDELAAKATAAVDTVNFLEQRAREQGHALHPDLLAQRSLVQSAMDDAEETLRAKDMGKLGERLQRARALIDRLYKMM